MAAQVIGTNKKKYLNNIKKRTPLTTMLNQKTVIYIILSAILLYLYYKRGGIAIFVAFVVVVAGTLFAGANEGFSIGGKGGNADKECAKMGFTETKIDKKNPIESLKKINDNFKKTLLKYATFDNNEFQLKEETQKLLKDIAESSEFTSRFDKEQKENKELFTYTLFVTVFFMNTYAKSDSGEMTFYVFREARPVQKMLDELKKEKDGTNTVKKAINSGESLLKMIREIKDLDMVKKADKKTKEAWNFLICAIKHTIDNIKKLDKSLSDKGDGGDGGDGGDDDADGDEKPKKKKKKATKKKKSDDDDGDEE